MDGTIEATEPAARRDRRGPASLAAGAQVVNGLAAYAFLVLAGRSLGDDDFAPVSVLWAMQFLVGSGLFVAYEQEGARVIAAHRALGHPVGPAASRMRRGFLLHLAGVLVVGAATTGVIRDELFDGDPAVVAALAVGVIGFALTHLVRGLLAGSEQYHWFAAWFLVDAGLRLGLTVALVAAGSRSPGLFAFAASAPPLAAAAIVAAGSRGRIAGAPDAGEVDATLPELESWALGRTIVMLTVASGMLAVLVNGGVVAVRWLAEDRDRGKAAVFLTGLTLTRIPLLLFQTVQAALIPPLVAAATRGDVRAVRRDLHRMTAGILGTGVVATAMAAVVGPAVLRRVFGPGLGSISAGDLAMQSAATFLVIATIALSLGLIALARAALVPLGWTAGVIAFGAMLAWPGETFLRTGRSMVVSGAVALVAMALTLEAATRPRSAQP